MSRLCPECEHNDGMKCALRYCAKMERESSIPSSGGLGSVPDLRVIHTGDWNPLGYLEKTDTGYVLRKEHDPSKGIPVHNGDTIAGA